MGNHTSGLSPCPDYELVLSGFFRDINKSWVIPLCIVQRCIQFCSENCVSHLLLCTGSTDYSYPQFNGIRILNLQTKHVSNLNIYDINRHKDTFINNKVSFDGGMFTKCAWVSNIRLPSFITSAISGFHGNNVGSYDGIFRFGRLQKNEFDLIAFDSELNKESIEKDINAYRLSLPSLPSSRIEHNIIYNKYNETLYCTALQNVEYLEIPHVPFLYSLKLSDFDTIGSMNRVTWQELGKCRYERNSVCIIGDGIDSELLMLGRKNGSKKAFLYDFDAKMFSEVAHMSCSRVAPGICHDPFYKKIFVAESNVVEIFDANKNVWSTIGSEMQNEHFQNPAVWTDGIKSDVVFVAGRAQYDDKETTYLQDLGLCEWIDLRCQRKWNILHDGDLLTLFKLDDIPTERNIFTRSIVPTI
eukprot:242758_1